MAADLTPVGKVKVEDRDMPDTAGNNAATDDVPKQKTDESDAKKEVIVKKAISSPINTKDVKTVDQEEKAKNATSAKKNDKAVKSVKRLAVTGGPNSFNRLLKPPSKRNLPPSKDGIHDPDNDGTHILQAPKDSFAHLPKSNTGNRVDWVAALKKGEINPRYDRIDTEKVPIILDLNIVREVKGSMPDVVYPHKQHTEWLDCSNCHPAIFIPMKGANNISMASILLGEKCGVCHGKVAFPVSECRKCHSKNK
ncbi:MAG: c(7)-type cytochrome triheme domain-containing protein [Candidatus Thiodiazotropha sp. (ex. Lucinoma kazani)]